MPHASPGDLRIGLIPTLTRAALAPTLEQFVPRYPDVRLHIVEGYSGSLTEMVLNDELDFAVVPTSEGRVGLKSRLLVRDREMLVSSAERGFKPLEPVRLKDCGPLKIMLPGRANVRRRNIEIYFQTHGVEIADMIEMDAMIGTLQFVARSDWVAILSGLICFADIGRPRTGDQSDLRPAADCRIRGDLAGAAHAVDPGATVPGGASRPRSRASRTSGRRRSRPRSIRCGRGARPHATNLDRRRRAGLLERMRPRERVVLHAGVEDALEVRERRRDRP